MGDSLPRLNVLEGLSRYDDGPLTELRARKAKLAFFDQQCSWVGDRLYVGSEAVARSRETLAASGITHVVNCVGFLYPPYFEGELAYKTLYLQGKLGGAGRATAATAGQPPPPPALPLLTLPPPAVGQIHPARTSCALCTTCLTSFRTPARAGVCWYTARR